MDISFGSANSEESCATVIEPRDRMEFCSTNFGQLQYAKETEGLCLMNTVHPMDLIWMHLFYVRNCYTVVHYCNNCPL